MRASQLLISTLKETPADATLISHQLMLRAGFIRKLQSGLYSWLPLGLKVLRKVEKIVREEMNAIGALEILMPSVQPAELWQESERWDQYGRELLKFKDRHQNDFCYGPTHEEVVTHLMRQELKSYKQLPMTVYQIQTKFRDEIRPRFGVMRAREFLMKDAYSFHTTQASLQKTYEVMYQAYTKIFTRLGLKFRAVLADTGSIGGEHSHEFHVLANSGEDALVYSDGSDYAANLEKARALTPSTKRAQPTQTLQMIDTPHQKTISAVCEFLKLPAEKTVKTLIFKGKKVPLVALILRGDHTLNEVKASHLEMLASPLEMAEEAIVKMALGCGFGSLGPVDLNIPTLVDEAASVLTDFCCGANIEGKHFMGVNWDRDVKIQQIVDCRNVEVGDASPDGKGTLHIVRGIEVGHIFQLRQKYSEAMKATYLDEQGKTQKFEMGCYGIGVSRLVAAAIEQNYDDRGIIWADAMAPFEIVLVAIDYEKSEKVRQTADELYALLRSHGFDVILDDRSERPGVKFADWELIGIPHRLVIGEKQLANGNIEYRQRRQSESTLLPVAEIETWIKCHKAFIYNTL